MKFTVAAFVTLIAAVMAAPVDVAPRQTVDLNAPAMTDADGNVVSFNTAGVNMASSKAGL